jgi:hypothetical protein
LKATVVRYQTQPDRANENQQLIEGVFSVSCRVMPMMPAVFVL